MDVLSPISLLLRNRLCFDMKKTAICLCATLIFVCSATLNSKADSAEAARILRIDQERILVLEPECYDKTGNGVITAADAEIELMRSCCDYYGDTYKNGVVFEGLTGERFLSKFTLKNYARNGIFVPYSYKSENVSVQVSKVAERTEDNRIVVYFIADIYLRNIDSFRTWYSGKKFGSTEQTAEAAESVGALIAVSGDFFSEREKGLCIRNGYILRESLDKSRDVCVLFRDGTIETYTAGHINIHEIEERDPWQAWSFGPSLLDENGHSKEKFNTNVARKNPRSALGYYEPGHYCFVVVDGRQRNYSYGMTMKELSELFERLGCSAAYNLDGGATAVMANLYGELNRRADTDRQCSDILYICEPNH